MATFFYFMAIIFFLLLCILLCGVILIQESKSSGLGSSFGGETSDSLFGTSTADVLKKITAYLAICFMAACITLAYWTEGLERTKFSTTPEAIIEDVQN